MLGYLTDLEDGVQGVGDGGGAAARTPRQTQVLLVAGVVPHSPPPYGVHKLRLQHMRSRSQEHNDLRKR